MPSCSPMAPAFIPSVPASTGEPQNAGGQGGACHDGRGQRYRTHRLSDCGSADGVHRLDRKRRPADKPGEHQGSAKGKQEASGFDLEQ